MQTLIYKIFNKRSVQFYVDWASSLLLSSGRNWSFHLQVLERKSLRCDQPEDAAKYLLVKKGGNISCPGLSCSDNADVIWYKMKRKVVCLCELEELWRNTHQFKLKWCISPSRVSELSPRSAEAPASTAAGCNSARSARLTLVCISVTDKPQTTGSSGEPLTSLLYVSTVRVQGLMLMLDVQCQMVMLNILYLS